MIEATKAFKLEHLNDHPSVIVLSIKNEIRLKNVEKYLSENNVKFVQFHEPDLDDQLTALATEPIFSDKRHLFQKYQLVKKPKFHFKKYALRLKNGNYYRYFGCGNNDEVCCLKDAQLFDEPKTSLYDDGDCEVQPVEITFFAYEGGC